MEIIWTSAAARELQEVYEQLEDRVNGGGARLLNEVERSLALLATQPFMGSYFEKPTRQLLVDRRYGLIYASESRGGDAFVTGLANCRDWKPQRTLTQNASSQCPSGAASHQS